MEVEKMLSTNYRKLIAVFLGVLMMISAGGCRDNGDPDSVGESTGNSISESISTDSGEISEEISQIDFSGDGLRRQVSADKPMFMFQAHDNQLKNLQRVIPADILQYTAFYIHASDYSTLKYDYIRSQLEYAEDNGLKVVLEIANFMNFESGYDKKLMPMSDLDTLFNDFSSLIGTAVAEMSPNRNPPPVYGDTKQILIDLIEKSAEHGGLFIWMDMGYITRDHIFLLAGEDEEVFQTIKENKDNVILVEKNNGNGKYYLTRALASGWWLAGLTGNWGLNMEDFWWNESGYGPLWEESQGWRYYGKQGANMKSIFSYPDALYGQGMLTALANGATLFNFEWHNKLLWDGAFSDEFRRTPTFNNVVAPLLQEMIRNSLIPSREEVKERVKVVYHATNKHAAEIRVTGEELFRGLYGNTFSDSVIRDKSAAMRFLPTTGRYEILPIIPKLAGADILEGFENVITAEFYKDLFPDENAKKAYFNNIYGDKVQGDSWVVMANGKWLMTNPNENVNIDTRFSFPLESDPGLNLSGVLHPHSYVIAQENDGKISFYLNNYRVKPGINWDPSVTFNLSTYLGKFVTNPDNSDVRTTTISLEGLSAKPELSLTGGDEGSTHTDSWDGTAGKYTVEITHNGQVRMDIVFD
ncbi:hypothetical protein EOM86_02570 [Candidatus Nomurabacteria bacterium]|nr:hypothetical protein [Candidatus Nomurabacteria bacterium]